MTTQTAVAFDENAIGPSLELTVGDSTLQTSATFDATTGPLLAVTQGNLLLQTAVTCDNARMARSTASATERAMHSSSSIRQTARNRRSKSTIGNKTDQRPAHAGLFISTASK